MSVLVLDQTFGMLCVFAHSESNNKFKKNENKQVESLGECYYKHYNGITSFKSVISFATMDPRNARGDIKSVFNLSFGLKDSFLPQTTIRRGEGIRHGTKNCPRSRNHNSRICIHPH